MVGDMRQFGQNMLGAVGQEPIDGKDVKARQQRMFPRLRKVAQRMMQDQHYAAAAAFVGELRCEQDDQASADALTVGQLTGELKQYTDAID